MSNISFVGVDIAKSKIDVCLYDSNFSNCVYATYKNDSLGFLELFSLLESVNIIKHIRIGFEATSTYMVNLQKFLDSLSVKYILINPKKLHHFIKYKNFESKTDKLDSYYIAYYITTLNDSSFNSSSNKTKNLYKGYQALINLVIKTETHLKALDDSVLSSDFTSPNLVNELLTLRETLSKTKNKLTLEHIQVMRFSIPEYDFIKKDLVGVGDKTLLAVLPLIYDVSEKYSIKQLQSFIGLNPVYKDSGSSIHKKQRISKSGNSEARKMLYMSAVASLSSNAELKLKYKRLVERGKPHKVALIAISAHIFRAIVNKLNYYKNLHE
jgi:transposase